jgi:hypothetical protein
MKQGSRRSWLALGAVAALAALGAVPASATNTVRYDTGIRIGDGPPAFHGKVSSEAHVCVKHRKVRMYKKLPGRDKLLGKGITNRRGHWKILVDPVGTGAYYARVRRREEGTAGTIYVCKRAKSAIVTAD